MQAYQWTGDQGTVVKLPKTDHTVSSPTTLGALGLQSPKELTHLSRPTGYMSGWWFPKREGGESGPLPPLATAWVTEYTHGGTTYAADAIPQETASCDVKNWIKVS